MKRYIRRHHYDALWLALSGEPNLLQVIVGPRQVGKSTLALQLIRRWPGKTLYQTADRPEVPGPEWLNEHWLQARRLCRRRKPGLLVLDEIQKVPRWSEQVKRLFDEDRARDINLRVILLGSSALLMQKGLAESMAGRFELHRHLQWSFAECHACFGLSFDEFLYFGGYPGGLGLRNQPQRWASYLRESLIETVLGRDLLLLAPVSKPILLRQSFTLAVANPARIISYQKMLGTFNDAGNVTTIASYLRLLAMAFLVVPLERWSGGHIRQRGSIPKILVMDNGLIAAITGIQRSRLMREPALRGFWLENAVGRELYALALAVGGELYYWRERNYEVDYVVRYGDRLLAIEVKSGVPGKTLSGLAAFKRRYPKAETVLLSPEADQATVYRYVSLESFFAESITALGIGR